MYLKTYSLQALRILLPMSLLALINSLSIVTAGNLQVCTETSDPGYINVRNSLLIHQGLIFQVTSATG